MRALFLIALLAFVTPAHAWQVTCLDGFALRYSGETERNLDRAFALAEQRDVILEFDEADALFGARSEPRDAHDRYANQEVSYLLERLERFRSIEPLASNNRRMLAAGFDRRSRYAGIIILETETGARLIEFIRASRARAIAYAEATLQACPVEQNVR